MTTKHTPGPWTVIPTTSEVFTRGNHIRVVQTTNSPNWHEAEAEMRANARLIAEAPTKAAEHAEMRAFLVQLRDETNESGKLGREVRALLARIDGGDNGR